MTTKADLKKMDPDELREVMSEHFEGITEETTKKEMLATVNDNWDEFLRAALNPPEDDEPEDDEDEAEEAVDVSQPNLATDLYSGHRRV